MADLTNILFIVAAKAEDDKFSFSYDYRLSLKTSFTGKDLLFSRLRAGNMKDGSAFSGGSMIVSPIFRSDFPKPILKERSTL